MQKLYIVVGDEYSAFAHGSDIVTVSELFEWLADASCWTGDEVIILGQGISGSVRTSLQETLRSRGIRIVVCLAALAPLHLTHKRYPENVLITAPRWIKPRCYLSDFVLSDGVDRLSDHVTGRHVGAMPLMEAGRQAAIAALEREYRPSAGPALGFVVEQFSSKFHTYVFPLPTLVRVSIDEKARGDKHISVVCTTTFSQSGRDVCVMRWETGVYQHAFLDAVEARQARGTVRALREHYLEAARPDLRRAG